MAATDYYSLIMGTDVNDIRRTYDAIRRHSDAESQRSGGGMEDMGADKDQYVNYNEAGYSGEGELRENKDEVRTTTSSGGNPTVAVIGDFLEDRYWIGSAERLSAEVPIPIVKITDNFFQPGGAGNVATNLFALGCNVHCLNYGGMPPTKNRLMVGDHQLARWDERDSCQPYQGLFHYEEWDALVVADYAKGAITPQIIEKINKFKGPIFVDTKGDPSVWSGVATAIFPNWKEYNQYAKQYLAFDGLVILKRGDKGLELRTEMPVESAKADRPLYSHISPSQARFVRSVNGAGDSVIAAFVYKYLKHRESYVMSGLCNECYKEILAFANAAAAVAVEHPYTYAPTLEEVIERLWI